MTGPLTDAEQAVREWVKTSSGIAGPGLPLTNGAHIGHISSPATATVAELARVGGGPDGSGYLDQPRISAQVYGPTREVAFAAAQSFGNALAGLAERPATLAGIGKIFAAFGITILWAPDGNRARYLVDAELQIAAL